MSSVDHMLARKSPIGIILVTFFCVISQALADDHINPESMRIGDSSLKVSSLELMLDPLTAEELDELALAWRDSLKKTCLLYTSPSPRDGLLSRMPSSA